MAFCMKSAIFFLTVLHLSGVAYAAEGPEWPDTLIALQKGFPDLATDSARIGRLAQMAFLFRDRLEDERLADSATALALAIALKNGDPRLIIQACNAILENCELPAGYERCLTAAKKALYHCHRIHELPLRWRTYVSLSAVHASCRQAPEAMEAARKSLAIARLLKNDSMTVVSRLSIGKAYELTRNIMITYRHYLLVRDLAQSLGNRSVLARCYRQLYQFYKDNRLYEDAAECAKKERDLVLRQKPVDSIALLWTSWHLNSVRIRMPDPYLAEEEVKWIVDYAMRTKNKRMKTWEFSLYRTYLLQGDRTAQLCKLYTRDYPGEFGRLKNRDPEMYCRVTAYCRELAGETDSSAFYFAKAEELILKQAGKGILYTANFYNRYGQFLLRHGKNKEALAKFERAFRLCATETIPGKFDYMIVASRSLEKLYRDAGDFRNAWTYAAATLRIRDSLSISSRTEQLMSENLKQERQKQEAAAVKNRLEIRQARNQLYMTHSGVGFFVIVSLLVYRNYRNQKRHNRLLDAAKQKSDQLLLNILPHETAEELKQTGRAKARQFEAVTVMFTDFKDFTQASERMNAEELVDVINFYFTEFDRIITRHNIEKIKIIGDSYMCAGGLPVPNGTHALDVVAAAVELQAFILEQKKRRSDDGKPFFEIRIGIHTGPVVAGIVGLKKFAYDIWGDTVNTASRMESAGEPNRVNISGATYERVKDRFACTYRGKVSAKHKGEIDMYFVSGESWGWVEGVENESMNIKTNR